MPVGWIGVFSVAEAPSIHTRGHVTKSIAAHTPGPAWTRLDRVSVLGALCRVSAGTGKWSHPGLQEYGWVGLNR